MYDKIKALISRNDFTTAEKLLDRHSTDLSERQKRELRDFIAEQQRNKQRDDLKRNKRLKLSGHWRAVWVIEKILFLSWLILGYVLYPYGKMQYFTLLSSWDGPPFQHRLGMELLFLLQLVLMALFFCFKSFAARRQMMDRREIKRQMEKSEKPDAGSIRLLEKLEKSNEKEARGWLIALLCTMAGITFHLVAMAIWF